MEEAPDNLEWRAFLAELKRRLLRPGKYPAFVIYFVLANIIFGSVGVWPSLYKFVTAQSVQAIAGVDGFRSLALALCTYFPAIVASSGALIIIKDDNMVMRAFSILLVVACMLVAIFVVFVMDANRTALVVSVLATIMSLFFCWVANGNDEDLVPPPNTQIGGNVGRKLPGSGKGFNV